MANLSQMLAGVLGWDGVGNPLDGLFDVDCADLLG